MYKKFIEKLGTKCTDEVESKAEVIVLILVICIWDPLAIYMKWVDEGEASEVMWLESLKSNIHGTILLSVEEKGPMSSKPAEDDEFEDSGPKDGIICWSCASMMDWIRDARSEAFVFLERTACWAPACGQCWGWPGHQCGPFGWIRQSLFQLFAVFSSYNCERICLFGGEGQEFWAVR